MYNSFPFFQVGKYTTTVEGIEAEPHHVWEYPSYPRSDVITLMSFDLSTAIHDKSYIHGDGNILLTDLTESCHGVVLWMDYVLTAEHTVTTGLLEVCTACCVRIFFTHVSGLLMSLWLGANPLPSSRKEFLHLL